MKENRYRLLLVIFTIVFVFLAVLAESLYFSDFEFRLMTRRFNKVLAEKEKIMDECLNGMRPVLARGEPHGSVSENRIFSIAEQNKITILEYIDNKLIYWSDNGFDVKIIRDDTLYSKPLIFLQNGWFLPSAVEAGNEDIVGLLRVRTDYGFENDIIKSGFEKDFRLPSSVGLSTENRKSDYRIFNSKGEFLFSLVFPEQKSNTGLIFVPLILWGIVLLLIILLALALVKKLIRSRKNYLAVAVTFLIFALIYLLVLFTGKPQSYHRTGLFSPYFLSLNNFIPSLGHLLLFSIFAAIFSYIFNRHFPLQLLRSKNQFRNYMILTILFAVAGLLFALLHILFSHLIHDSNISFETYKVLKLSIFSAEGYTSVFLLFLKQNKMF